jgi:hypothetical protein
MIAWLADLNAKERWTMAGCFGGGALDAFESAAVRLQCRASVNSDLGPVI